MAGDDNKQRARPQRPDSDSAINASLARFDDCGVEEDPLAALRAEWLLRAADQDEAVSAASVIAATEPLTSDQRAQIVQRLLRERQQTVARAADPTTLSGKAPPKRGTNRNGPPPAWSMAVAGSLAAACALCVWHALPARQQSGAARHEQTTTLVDRHAPAPARTASTPSSELERARDEAARLTALAELLVEQEKFAEAEAHLREALELRERALGPLHDDVAATLTRLAGLYQSQQMYAKADPLYLRAFEIKPPFAVF